jgi:hypothetical protein
LDNAHQSAALSLSHFDSTIRGVGLVDFTRGAVRACKRQVERGSRRERVDRNGSPFAARLPEMPPAGGFNKRQ